METGGALKAGDWVEVRSLPEILATLDERGQLDKLPFMPEMSRFCGQRFQVYKRAHRTCDTVDYVGGRGMRSTVHLEGLRCDGQAHAGCNALCLLFWKEAWLKRAEPAPASGHDERPFPAAPELLIRGTRKSGEAADVADPTWVCQATQLLEASVPLRRLQVGPYVEDVSSGNVPLSRLLASFGYVVFEYLVGGRYGIGTPLRLLYDTAQRLAGGSPFPERPGRIPKGGKTPSRRLDLQPGELVRVRSLDEILDTVDESLRNRGMGFHSEMVQYTGRTYRVLQRIERIVNEKTGRMIHMKNDAVILEGVVCKSRFINNCRRFCPRSVYLYFREIWLERVEPAAPPAAALDGAEAARERGAR